MLLPNNRLLKYDLAVFTFNIIILKRFIPGQLKLLLIPAVASTPDVRVKLSAFFDQKCSKVNHKLLSFQLTLIANSTFPCFFITCETLNHNLKTPIYLDCLRNYMWIPFTNILTSCHEKLYVFYKIQGPN